MDRVKIVDRGFDLSNASASAFRGASRPSAGAIVNHNKRNKQDKCLGAEWKRLLRH